LLLPKSWAACGSVLDASAAAPLAQLQPQPQPPDPLGVPWANGSVKDQL